MDKEHVRSSDGFSLVGINALSSIQCFDTVGFVTGMA